MIGRGFQRVVFLAALLLGACGEVPVVPQDPAAVLLGEWRYARPAPAAETPSLNAGQFVTIVIDSAVGTRFAGRVTAWFIGDAGVSTDRFGGVNGSVDDTLGVTLRIAARTEETAAYTVIGRFDEDVIVVLESWVGTSVGPFPIGGRFHRSP